MLPLPIETLLKNPSSLWSQDFINKNTTMIGNKDNTDIDGNNPISFGQILKTMIMQGRVEKIVKEKSRTYKQILQGIPAYSEVVLYRVAKHNVGQNGQPSQLPIQNFWFTNPEDADNIVLNDTQVKYDKNYRYLVYAYAIVVGSEYNYSSLDLQGLKDDLWQTSCFVSTRPKLRIVRIPYYGFSSQEDSELYVYDDPPPAPNVSFYPIRGNTSQIKVFLNGAVDRYEKYPIFLQEEDLNKYNKVRRYQKKDAEDKIKFESDDPASTFQIFRIDPDRFTSKVTPPQSYRDFETKLHKTVNEVNQSPNGFTIENLLPNLKYYYCFRTIDSKGNVSDPSEVFEVEIQSQPGISLGFPVIKIYEMSKGEPKVATKPFKRYLYLKATPPQVAIPEEIDGPSTAVGTKISTLGVTNEKLFLMRDEQENINKSKKFKIRLTSRQTGRKIDVNVRFVYKQTE